MTNNYESMISQVTRDGIQTGEKMNDSDFVLCEYLGQPPGNISDHSIVGVTIFPDVLSGVPMFRRGDGWSIDYRYKKAGDTFLVHREDLARSPNWFRAVELDKKGFESALPKQRSAPLSAPPEPEPLARILEKAISVPAEVDEIDGGEPVQQAPVPGLQPPTLIAEQTAPVESQEPISEKEAVASMMTHILNLRDLQVLPGVTNGIAEQMVTAGITSYQDILNLGVSGLVKFKGVADTRANMIIDAISAMMVNAG